MDLPTERTPLLDRPSEAPGLPCLSVIEKTLQSPNDGLSPCTPHAITRCVRDHLPNPPSEAARLALPILVALRHLESLESNIQAQRAEIETFVVEKWMELRAVEVESVRSALWIPFPLDEESDATQNVMQAVLSPSFHCPESISLDPLTAKSLLEIWRQGRPVIAELTSFGMRANAMIVRLHVIVAPRVLHLTELAIYSVYLVAYAIYVIEPPRHYGERIHIKMPSLWLLIYATSRIIKEPRKTPISFYITFLAFLTFLPSEPGATDFPYFNALLLAFGLHIIHLLVPRPPSPVLLMPSRLQLPLADMLQYLFDRVLIPVFLFFLPVFILAMILLADSVSIPSIFSTVLPAPIATRYAILTLCFVLLILFFGLIASMTLQISSLRARSVVGTGPPLSWDIYGPTVGLAVRQNFFSSAFTYSQPFFFPAPLNIVQFVLVSIPYHFLLFLGRRKQAASMKRILDTALWCVLVVPLAMPFGVFWMWGLL